MTHFLEPALGNGSTPLVCLDGPVSEIKRQVRIAIQEKWAKGNYPYFFTLGYGLEPLTGMHHDNEPAESFAGAPNEMVDWLHDICRDGLEKEVPNNLLIFVFDLSILQQDPVLVSKLVHLTDLDGPAQRTAMSIVLCGPGIIHDLPAELREQCVKLRCPLPTPDQIKSLFVRAFAATKKLKTPDVQVLDRLSGAAAGMTSAAINNLSARSLYQHRTIKESEVALEIQSMLLDMPGVSLLDTEGRSLNTFGGYDAIKQSMYRALLAVKTKPKANCKGFLIAGPPGTGKTELSRSVAGEIGWKAVLVRPNEFKDKYVGESGKNMARFITLCEALAPIMVILDEVDGAFGNHSGAKESDSSGDILTPFLSWQSMPRQQPIWINATCNRLDMLPPEFGRAGRFNKRFFMDVPGRAAKDAIWAIYMAKYELAQQPRPNDHEWTGAEIEACCETAYVEDIPLLAAAEQVTPVAVQMGGLLDHVRLEATKACLDAETGIRYKVAVKGASAPPPAPPPAIAGGTIKIKD